MFAPERSVPARETDFLCRTHLPIAEVLCRTGTCLVSLVVVHALLAPALCPLLRALLCLVPLLPALVAFVREVIYPLPVPLLALGIVLAFPFGISENVHLFRLAVVQLFCWARHLFDIHWVRLQTHLLHVVSNGRLDHKTRALPIGVKQQVLLEFRRARAHNVRPSRVLSQSLSASALVLPASKCSPFLNEEGGLGRLRGSTHPVQVRICGCRIEALGQTPPCIPAIIIRRAVDD